MQDVVKITVKDVGGTTNLCASPSGLVATYDDADRAAILWNKTDPETLAQFFDDCAKMMREKGEK
jgi:hypothetical protein